MASSITHTQVRSSNVAPAITPYRVVDTVTASVGIAKEVFVFRVADSQFDHVATVLDMQTYSQGVPLASFALTLAAATLAGAPYFRWSEVTRDHADVNTAQDFAATLKQRMTSLALEYDLVTTAFVGSDVGQVLPIP